MINKIYSKVKQFIKENLFFIILPFIVIGTLSFPLPYYIEAPGGIINIDKKVNVKNGKDINGSLNLAYVAVYDGNIGTYLLSKINKAWDLIPSSNIQVGNENRSDVKIRNKVLLDNSLSNAYYVAYKNIDKDLVLPSYDIQVLFIDENADTNIEVGDKIIKIDEKEINSTDDILDYLATKNIKDKLKVIVNDGEEKYIVIGTLDGKKSLLISVVCNYDYDEDISFHFNKGESGPSGGFMIALSIYSKNIEQDLIKGRKVVGTGTIDIDGNVGEIGGIKYKIMGAIKEDIDIFFIPVDNYKEAKEIVEKYDYNINLVPIKTFKDAIDYLNK